MQPYAMSVKDTLSHTQSIATGLTNKDAAQRLAIHGPNELTAKNGTSPFVLFINQFNNFIIYILLFAVILSFISKEFIDASIILAILLFNAIFGFLQEYKAEKAIDALKKLAGLKVTVIRDGKNVVIDTKDLVVGDIMLIEEGTKISADARLIDVNRLHVMEASLTGESVPVSKHADTLKVGITINDQKNMVFSGTTVASGRAKAVVVAIGMETEIGKIATILDKTEDEQTPLQQKLEQLGKYIGIGTLIICFGIFLIGVFKEHLLDILLRGDIGGFIFSYGVKEWLLVAVSLAVAAVPEGLPAIVTVALAIGVKRMIKRNALIRKLPSVETLGETTIICSDKTGTLTKNEMTVRQVWTNNITFFCSGDGYDTHGTITGKKRALKEIDHMPLIIGAVCNNASLSHDGIVGDPTEAALLVSAAKASVKPLISSYKRLDEQPFDSNRKMMSVLVESKKKKFVFTKGAAEHLVERSTHILEDGKVRKITNADKHRILDQNDTMARQALRVLGFAYRPHRKQMESSYEHDLIFVGLQGMIDPPHPQVADAIKRCNQAGIRVVMITGDNKTTAQAIAHEVGIMGDALNGADFALLSLDQKKAIVNSTSIFARVEPAHKMEIVSLLQDQGHVVAMTGDGVNDAPAIKKSDLGIAMGITGTDVAKEASDMVLVDDNFTSIVNAIEEGRGIFLNIKKFVNYLLSCNLGEVFIVAFAIFFGWDLPLTAVMLLWLNLVTDGLPALALGVDPNPTNLMSLPPKKKSDGVMSPVMIRKIAVTSVLITVSVLGLFAWALSFYSNLAGPIQLERAQSIAFTALIFLEIVRLQNIRSEYKLGLFSNKYLVMAIAVSLGLQLLVLYTPLSILFGVDAISLLDWGMIVAASAIVALLSTFINNVFQKIWPLSGD
ncbi:MAG TPA: cation-translocating P-type ATPase [Acidobacteriota bacterium]|nr:cation-translocating P-type ATPase [Acidobacteriota bacterium]